MIGGDRETLIAEAMLGEPPQACTRLEWWRGAVFYEVYVRSFRDSTGNGIGDLRGVIGKLDYLADLGVDGIWLSPFYQSPQKDFGYDITDFRNVDPCHGSLDDFARLLEEAHARGLKVLIDFVPGHTSDEHPWFLQSRQDRNNPRADWYVWADAARDGGPPSNWLSSFGGPAWTWEPRRSQYYYHPFLTCQPALNLQNPETLEAVVEDMKFWLDMGVDGFRVDAVQCLACDPSFRSNPPAPPEGSHVWIGGGPNNPFGRQVHLFDRDVPESIAVMERLRAAVASYIPERVLIGELADVDSSRISEKYTVAGKRFHAVYDFDLINAADDKHALIEKLRQRCEFVRTGWLMNVFTNHDSKRAVSNLAGFAVEQGCAGEAAKMLLFLQFTLQGGGIIYQGEELGLTHPLLEYAQLQDPWGKNLWPDFQGRDGARTPMPWQAKAPDGGFTDGGRPWLPVVEEHLHCAVDRQLDDPASCLAFTRRLLQWRREEPLLRCGDEKVHGAQLAPLVVYDRFDAHRRLTFVVNFSLQERWYPLGRQMQPLDVVGCATDRTPRGLRLPGLGFAVIECAGRPQGGAEGRNCGAVTPSET